MANEFTAWCTHYYQLTIQHSQAQECLQNLLDKAPLYSGQTKLSEVDAIIDYYRNAQSEKAKVDKLDDDLKQAGRVVLAIMQHFEISPGTVLTGEIPGELAYIIWADEQDKIYISKTRDLDPAADNPNVITIKLSGAGVSGHRK